MVIVYFNICAANGLSWFRCFVLQPHPYYGAYAEVLCEAGWTLCRAIFFLTPLPIFYYVVHVLVMCYTLPPALEQYVASVSMRLAHMVGLSMLSLSATMYG